MTDIKTSHTWKKIEAFRVSWIDLANVPNFANCGATSFRRAADQIDMVMFGVPPSGGTFFAVLRQSRRIDFEIVCGLLSFFTVPTIFAITHCVISYHELNSCIF